MTSARALPLIEPQRCTGCGWCVAVCAPHVLSLHTPEPGGRKRSVLHDATACTGCALCAVRCPFGAITMAKKPPHTLPDTDFGLQDRPGGLHAEGRFSEKSLTPPHRTP